MTTSVPERICTAAVLVIDNEILSGRLEDASIGWLARALEAAGIRLREARVVPDTVSCRLGPG